MSRTTEGLSTAQVAGPLFRLVDELADTFRGVFSRNTIERYVDDTYELLASQAIRTWQCHRALRRLAPATAHPGDNRPVMCRSPQLGHPGTITMRCGDACPIYPVKRYLADLLDT